MEIEPSIGHGRNGRYFLSTGCQWRAIPKDLPPKTTLYDYSDLWTYDGTLEDIHHSLYVKCREQGEREASPAAAIIDSQRKKRRKRGPCIDRPGYDAKKKSRVRSGIFLYTHWA